MPSLGRFTHRERPGTHRTGGWVNPNAVLDRRGIPRPDKLDQPSELISDRTAPVLKLLTAE